MSPPTPATPTTTPFDLQPVWKPTQREIHAAALAIARVDQIAWHRLPACQQEDYLIDGHRALIEAHKVRPRNQVTTGADLVCMTKEHADLYADLFRVCDRMASLGASDDLADLRTQEHRIISRLRALASPERTTP